MVYRLGIRPPVRYPQLKISPAWGNPQMRPFKKALPAAASGTAALPATASIMVAASAALTIFLRIPNLRDPENRPGQPVLPEAFANHRRKAHANQAI